MQKMFRKSKDSQQISLDSPSMKLQGRSQKLFIDSNAWHNSFRNNILRNIDEDIFNPLYDSIKGAPNVSIKLLVGMMILKEGFGWSDQQLFENVRFNLIARSALALVDLDDPVPAESSYYLFRKRLHDYFTENNIDLIEQLFSKVTQIQCFNFNVSGKAIRMDSKLVGSNIANYTRYRLIVTIVKRNCILLSDTEQKLLPEQDQELCKEIRGEDVENTIYHNNSKDIRERLISIGSFISSLLNTYENKESEELALLRRIFIEHYQMNKEVIKLISNENISDKTLQAPDDQDATYRKKREQRTKGFSANITETCNDEGLNLIVGPELKQSDTPDNEFLQSGAKKSKEMTGQQAVDIHVDGAYNSEDNQKYCKVAEQEINLYLTGIQGNKGNYSFELIDNQLNVTNIKTGACHIADITKKGAYKIQENGKNRYFLQKQIDNYKYKKSLELFPKKILNKRNNVEATIFQLSYHLKNKKTKYRGLFKNTIWMFMRCLWINAVRIKNNIAEIGNNYDRKRISFMILLVTKKIASLVEMLTRLELNGFFKSKKIKMNSYIQFS